MLFILKLLLITELPLRAQASDINFHGLPAKNLDIIGTTCPARTVFSLPQDHESHHHHDLYPQEARYDEYTNQSSLWSRDPICRLLSSGNYCIYTNSSFADGRGIVLITLASIAEELAQLPAFTTPRTIKTSGPPPFEVRPVPDRGHGVVANKTIERGDRLMMFSPIIVIHPDALTEFDETELAFFNSALSHVPNASLSLFKSLVPHFNRTDENWERMVTNSFAEDIVGQQHSIVLPETARMNHDCRPNAVWYFDSETLTHYVHASRRIFPGEEITVSYTDPVQTRDKQTSKLKNVWGFDCTCSLCQASPEASLESDVRLRTIFQLSVALEKLSPESAAGPESGEMLISLYEMERLYSNIADAYLLTSMAYSAVGDEWKTVEYAMKASEATMLHYGPKSKPFKMAEQLMTNPRSHQSWMARRQNAR